MAKYEAPRSLRLGPGGRITIPADWRREMGLDEGGSVRVLALGKSLLLTPAPSRRAALARAFQAEMNAKGLGMRDLLAQVEKQRTG